MPTKPELVLLLRRNFSFVACYSLKFTCCSLLPVKSLVTRCKILSLLVAEVARCKKSLVTRCKIHSLLVAEVGSLYEKETPPQVLPCELLWNFKNTYSVKNQRTAASENNIKISANLLLQFFTSSFLLWFDSSLIELLLTSLIKLN